MASSSDPTAGLYTGVGLQFDAKAGTKAYANSVISIDKRSGGSARFPAFASTWMLTFVKGSRSPLVTVLGRTARRHSGAGPDRQGDPGSQLRFPTL